MEPKQASEAVLKQSIDISLDNPTVKGLVYFLLYTYFYS